VLKLNNKFSQKLLKQANKFCYLRQHSKPRVSGSNAGMCNDFLEGNKIKNNNVHLKTFSTSCRFYLAGFNEGNCSKEIYETDTISSSVRKLPRLIKDDLIFQGDEGVSLSPEHSISVSTFKYAPPVLKHLMTSQPI